MPARDRFHNAVKTGLEKQGWKITYYPLTVSFELGDMYRTYAKYLSNPHFSVTSVPGVVRYSMNLA
jgi:hypothetical protein